jgi:hypothetical protein
VLFLFSSLDLLHTFKVGKTCSCFREGDNLGSHVEILFRRCDVPENAIVRQMKFQVGMYS